MHHCNTSGHQLKLLTETPQPAQQYKAQRSADLGSRFTTGRQQRPTALDVGSCTVSVATATQHLVDKYARQELKVTLAANLAVG